MSRMLKALSHIDDKSSADTVPLVPLSSAELAELNAKRCRMADGDKPATAVEQPVEAALDRAEQLLRHVAPAEEMGETSAAEGDPTACSLSSVFSVCRGDDCHAGFSQAVSTHQGLSDAWVVSAETEPPPAMFVADVEPARLDGDVRKSATQPNGACAVALDIAVSHEVRVSDDYPWRVGAVCQPALARDVLLVESPRLDKFPSAIRHSAAKPPVAARPKQVAGEERPFIERVSLAKVPRAPGGKRRRQYEQVARQLLSDSSQTESALLLFSHIDQHTPTAAQLGPLAAVLSELEAGDVLLTEAHFDRAEDGGYSFSDPFPGLADYLQSAVAWDNLPVARSTSLSVLAGGSWQPQRKGALSGTECAARVAELKSMYRLVLVDTTGISRRAARGLVDSADSVYLFATLGHTTSDDVDKARSAVRADGGTVGGCIMLYQPAAT